MQADTHLVRSIKHINNPQILDEKAKSKKGNYKRNYKIRRLLKNSSSSSSREKEERNTRFVKQWMEGEKK